MTTPQWQIPPEDPDADDSIGNEDRSEFVDAALDTFKGETRQHNEDMATVVGDFLCDLAHWCDRHMEELGGETLGAIITKAALDGHYDYETLSQGRQFHALGRLPARSTHPAQALEEL